MRGVGEGAGFRIAGVFLSVGRGGAFMWFLQNAKELQKEANRKRKTNANKN